MPQADVCLILEGTYPYVLGGVSGWTHELIKEQSHLTFTLVCIMAPGSETKPVFDIPQNVVGIKNVFIQSFPDIVQRKSKAELKKFHDHLAELLLGIDDEAAFGTKLKQAIVLFGEMKGAVGKDLLMNSKEAWHLLVKMYEKSMSNLPFVEYFWTWRVLLGSLYSILMADIPAAKCYHALCTGYAGLLLARAKITTGKSCIITEHGIYTNERRIELSSADWLYDQKDFSLNLHKSQQDRELRDFWIEMFGAYSRLCYEMADEIITLYQGNQTLQLLDGAPPEKLKIIANGIDVARFSAIVPKIDKPPTIAFIGRVVPIKDVKTFVRAAAILAENIPNLRAFIIGPTDEDRVYFEECQNMVKHAGLEDVISFTGRVSIIEYLGEIDVQVLTSVSEAQPLVILEAGAAGIPSVATDVGACKEMLLGADNENPSLGPGGVITPLSNPGATAAALLKLLHYSDFYSTCSASIARRVEKYYSKAQQHNAYRELYSKYIH